MMIANGPAAFPRGSPFRSLTPRPGAYPEAGFFYGAAMKNNPTPPPPTVQEVARALLGAMNAKHPPDPLGYAVARDAAGEPLYLLACVQGKGNVERFRKSLQKLAEAANWEPVEDV
jgi:hypothetical protein